MTIDCKRLSINGMMRLPIKQVILYQRAAGNTFMLLENEPCAWYFSSMKLFACSMSDRNSISLLLIFPSVGEIEDANYDVVFFSPIRSQQRNSIVWSSDGAVDLSYHPTAFFWRHHAFEPWKNGKHIPQFHSHLGQQPSLTAMKGGKHVESLVSWYFVFLVTFSWETISHWMTLQLSFKTANTRIFVEYESESTQLSNILYSVHTMPSYLPIASKLWCNVDSCKRLSAAVVVPASVFLCCAAEIPLKDENITSNSHASRCSRALPRISFYFFSLAPLWTWTCSIQSFLFLHFKIIFLTPVELTNQLRLHKTFHGNHTRQYMTCSAYVPFRAAFIFNIPNGFLFKIFSYLLVIKCKFKILVNNCFSFHFLHS